MSESRLRHPPHADYRVIEHMRKGLIWLSIHRVEYDHDGEPIGYDHEAACVGGITGDDMVKQLDELAMALTKPSLLAEEFKLPGLGLALQ